MQNPNQSAAPAVRAAETQAPTFNLRLNRPAYWNTPNPAMEEKLLAHWKELGLRDVLAEARTKGETFWLLDGPPYANGDAHLGHLLNKTLKDVNARYQSAMGKNVVWRAGWDCHGLPLELAVEKRHGPGAKDDPAAFMAACRAEASTWQQAQAAGMQRLGLSADFDQPWLTMDPQREASSLNLLKELWEAGLLVERHSPVHWCPACQSALAASELEKGEKTRKEAFFLARLTDASTATLQSLVALPNAALHVLSWTTTPWTLWANAAFAHPVAGPMTVATLTTGKVALMAEAARDALLATYPELLQNPGYEFDGVMDFAQLPELALEAVSPLSGWLSPLMPASFALAGEGSGFVHVAPAFGVDDFSLHEERGVRLECHVGANGRLVTTDEAYPLPPELEGLTLEAATDASCELLAAAGLLAHAYSNTVEAQTCWRHKKATFYRASQQWALDLHAPFAGCPEGLAARATTALEATTFLPDNRAKTPLLTMLATRRFWTVSRDRLWGLPLPFFRHAETNALHPDMAALWGALVSHVRTQGVEAWQSFPVPAGYRRTGQTVDVWFDSGAAWHSASEGGRHRPDLGVEGRDQTRGWFLSSFLLHAFKSAEPAFSTLMTHSFVVGEDGLKLSKSKGGSGGAGAMTPAAVFAKEGADAFRLWVCAQNVGDEARWGKTALKQASQDLKDWRSFLRFMLANMAAASHAGQPAQLQALDQLALHKAAAARDEWSVHMASGRFNQAMQTLSAYRLWASTEWFELNKRTLYCARDDDAALLSVQWALQQVFVLFCRMLAPVLPFATEEAYLAWPQHPDVTVFLGLVPKWDFPRTGATDAVEKALGWRRGLLPLVERGRALVAGEGVPVALGFGGCAPAGFTDDMLRDWFPGTYPRLDGVKEQFSKSAVDEGAGVVAGRATTTYEPVRCTRCRGYFERVGPLGMCGQCEAEYA